MQSPLTNLAGVGLGARPQHVNELLESDSIPWLELLIDNFVGKDKTHQIIEKLRQKYPLTFHSVNLSIGSTDEINWDYLAKIKDLANRYRPEFISDHLCWVSHNSNYLHDLLPLPYTQESINHVCERIHKIQEFFGAPLVIENVSHYFRYNESSLFEVDFINSILENTGAKLILDVNNLYINAYNFKFNPITEFINKLNPDNIAQIHIAGHDEIDDFLVDTHGTKICDNVWQLYDITLNNLGLIPTSIEWDNDIPPFSILEEQRLIAQSIFNKERTHVTQINAATN